MLKEPAGLNPCYLKKVIIVGLVVKLLERRLCKYLANENFIIILFVVVGEE